MILRHATIEIGHSGVPGCLLVRNDEHELHVPVASVPRLVYALLREAGPACAAAARAVERAAAAQTRRTHDGR